MEEILFTKKSAPTTRVVKAAQIKPCDYRIIPGRDGKEDTYQRLVVYVTTNGQQVTAECTTNVFKAITDRKLDMYIEHYYFIHYSTDNQVCRVEPVKSQSYSYNMIPEEDQGIKELELLIEEGGFSSVRRVPPKMDAGDVERIKRFIDAATEVKVGDRICGVFPVVSYTRGMDGITLKIDPRPATVR